MMNTTDNKEASQVYKAKVEQRKKLSLIWILPVIVFAALCWIAYDAYAQRGTNITIVFKSGEGLKEGVTPLEYKGLQLGKVTKIDINDDLQSVKINILLKSEVAKYVATEKSRFWIQKPTVSLTKISGLSTLMSGYKIELSPMLTGGETFDTIAKKTDIFAKKTHFVGLDEKPEDELDKNGYYISLIAADKSSIEVGMPVFYSKYQIGEVISRELKDRKVLLNVLIYNKYSNLVNKSSKFIMNSAIKVSYGAGGLNVEVGSLYSALVGGITVVTENKDAGKIDKNQECQIYDDKDDMLDKTNFSIKFFSADGIGEGTPIIYKGVVVGKLADIILNRDDVLSKAYIYDKYKYLLTKGTKFFIVKADIGLDGVKNLGTIFKGNYVSLSYANGEFTDKFDAVDYQSAQDSLHNIELTLYADELGSIGKNSKVYFKNIVIGNVVDYGLADNLSRVKIKIAIDEKYKKLINDKTLFYNIGSKLVEIKNLNLNVNYNGAESLLNGGIALVDVDANGKFSKQSFKLYSSYKDVEKIKRVSAKGFVIKTYFDNSFNLQKDTPIVYKNQEIGFVKESSFAENQSVAELFIYEDYKKYITTKSRFYKKAAVNIEASLSGLIFEVSNFSSLLFGAIHLNNDAKAICEKYEIFASEDEMRSATNSVTIIFKDTEGLKERFSQLTYKGVKIGKVTKISLNSDKKVVVNAQIYNDYDAFAKAGTTYYLKKPKISLQQVENVGASVMPIDIGVIKSDAKEFQSKFVGFDSLSMVERLPSGNIYKVISKHSSSANVDSPIYYKNIEIGKINRVDLSNDGSSVVMDCLIYEKYTKLIRKNSTFYDISGLKVNVSLFSGAKIETNTLASIAKGGLLVVTPMNYGNKANVSDKFILEEKAVENWQNISPAIQSD